MFNIEQGSKTAAYAGLCRNAPGMIAAMQDDGDIPFTCRACHANFSVAADVMERGESVNCPECGEAYTFRREQLKSLSPGRRGTKDQ